MTTRWYVFTYDVDGEQHINYFYHKYLDQDGVLRVAMNGKKDLHGSCVELKNIRHMGYVDKNNCLRKIKSPE